MTIADDPTKQIGQLITSIDLDAVPPDFFSVLNPLYVNNTPVEYLINPYTGSVVFSSDNQYWFDDAHGGGLVNPFVGMVPNGADVVDAVGNVVLTYREYLSVYPILEYRLGTDMKRKIAIATAIEKQLNSIQKYGKFDPEYLTRTADDLAIAILNESKEDYMEQMAANSCPINVDNPLRFGTPNGGVAAVPTLADPYRTNARFTTQDVIQIISSARKAKDFGLTPLAQSIDADADRRVTTMRIEAEDADEAVAIDVSNLEGVITPSNGRAAYNHIVSNYKKSSDEIFAQYALGRVARSELEEVHVELISKLRAISPTFAELEARAENPMYGWDVFSTYINASKNCIEIRYVHDLRLHEWEDKLSHRYRKKD